MIKNLTIIVGNRPHYIKLAPLIRAWKNFPQLSFRIIHTGQHYDDKMYEDLWQELELPEVDHFLNINQVSNTQMLSEMLISIGHALDRELTDLVMVFGDTNTSLAGALAAKQKGVLLAHIEAGMRNFDLNMAEEQNRRLIDSISDFLFCANSNSYRYLEKTKAQDQTLVFSGDLMLENYLHYKQAVEEVSKEYILCTLHRAELVENQGYLEECLEALNTVNTKIPVKACFHPRTADRIQSSGINIQFEDVGAVSYTEMIQLVANAKLVVTDSGGLQKEAFFASKKCVTIRSSTEWIETLENDNNLLAAYEQKDIVNKINLQLQRPFKKSQSEPFGAGNAATIILNALSLYRPSTS